MAGTNIFFMSFLALKDEVFPPKADLPSADKTCAINRSANPPQRVILLRY
jgi:hypothetical protein